MTLKKIFTLAGLWALFAGSLRLYAQPKPVIYWTFDCVNHAEFDAASDGNLHNFNVPGNTTFINAETRPFGPVGSYIHKVAGNRGYSTPLQGIMYNTQNNFPSTPNPNGFSIEMLFRAGFPSSRFGFFTYFERLSVNLSSGGYQIGTFYENGNFETHGITLNGYDRLDHRYYMDGNWHHFALVYEWCEESAEGGLQIYIDGQTQPELYLALPYRLRHANHSTIYMHENGLELNNDYDEVLMYDDAIEPGLIYQHYLDFQAGTNFCLSCPPVANIPPMNTPVLSRKSSDYPVGYNLTGQNGPFPNSSSINPIVSQTQHYPVPRYWPQTQMPRNHIFPGYLPQLAHNHAPIGNTGVPTAQLATEVADLFDELYKNFHHSYFVAGLNNINNDFTNEFVSRVNNSNGSIQDLLAVTTWPHVPSATGTNCDGTPYVGPFIHSPSLPQSEYMIADNPNPGVFPNPTYSLFAFGIQSQVLSSFPDARAIGFHVNPSYALDDGQFVGNNLIALEQALNNSRIKYFLENGEEGPSLLPLQSLEQLHGSRTYNVYLANCSTDVALSSPATAQNFDVYTDFIGMYPTAAPPFSSLDWLMYQSMRKERLRNHYYQGIWGTPPSAATGRQVLWYWNSGNSIFHYPSVRDNNINHLSTPANQTYYPTPYMYPQVPSRWFTGQGPLTGLKDVLLGRNVEISLGDHYFVPAVSPGYDDGNFGVEDLNMTRPGQYLGQLKSLLMLGAENFESFQYNVSSKRIHHSSMFGWMFSTPAYAQATVSHVEPLFYGSHAMNGNYEFFYNEGITSPGHGDYRFWAGQPGNLVMAREGHGIHTGDYLISGTVQNMVGENEYDVNHPIYSDGDRFVSSQILGGNNPPLQFEIRKQGSTYYLDNSNPAQPIFVQLDKWHEDAHPDHWSKDFFMEAEVFDDNTSNIFGSPLFVPATDGADFLPVTDGNFQNFTTYMNSGGAVFSQGNGPTDYLEYRIQPRDLSSQNNMHLWVRLRVNPLIQGTSAIFSELWDQNGTLIQASPVQKTGTSCWTWVYLDSYSFNQAEPYSVRIFPYDHGLDIDQVAVVTGSTHTQMQGYVQPGLSMSMNTLPSTVCQGEGVPFTITFTGEPPFALHFVGDNGLEVYKNITSYTWSTVLHPVPGGSTYSIPLIADRNCMIDPQVTFQIKANPVTAPVITQTPANFCVAGPVTLTSSPGSSYLWSTGATTQSISVTEPGTYCVTVTTANGCTAASDCHQIQPFDAVVFANPGLEICPGTTTTLNATTGRSNTATYLWSTGATTGTIVAGAGNFTVTITDGGCNHVVNTTITNPQPTIHQPAPVLVNSAPITLTAGPGGGLWEIDLGNGFVPLTTAPSFVPSQYLPGVYPIRYTVPSFPIRINGGIVTTCTTPVSANSTISVIDFCPNTSCPNFQPVILYENHFKSCQDCPGNLNGVVTNLTEDCIPTLNPNAHFAITNDDVSWGSGNSVPTSDHTGITGSQYLLANAATSGSATKVIHSTFVSDPGKRYLLMFHAAAIQNTFSLKVYVNGNIVQTSNLLSPGNPWEQICADFQGPGGVTTLDVEMPINSGTDYWVAIDDLYFMENGPAIQIFGPQYVISGQSAPLSVINPSQNVTYEWCEVGVTCPTPFPPVIGTPSSQYNTPGLTYQGPGTDNRTYRVTAHYGNGCMVYQDYSFEVVPVYNKMNQPLTEETPPRFSIYPNPNLGQFTLSLNLPEKSDVAYVMFDMMGRELLRGDVPNVSGEKNQVIDLTAQSAGVYFLKVWAGTHTEVFRVVRE